MSSTWDKVMEMKKNDTRHQGLANNLNEYELETIIGTIDFFGGSVQQAFVDLSFCKYRIFDWLAMGVMGGRIGNKEATQVLVYSFLKANGNIDKWIKDLRATDYDIVRDWESIEV